ncbi:MAG TPA: FKBP-type peptidyl-prolyl cis-trans isomerase [Bacteroidales bacterium]|mgnify:CR=1 FL=1|jgi:FKBP-type peptidyl-prolyl cis-trans isomerase|nr:FKBP-type peptidyl-prolyl cis-trans isomerase [Bacteroidales bacterium]
MRRIVLFTLLILAFGCKNEGSQNPSQGGNNSNLKETLIKANQKVVLTEDEQINNLINRYGWKMEETGTGLRYFIYKKGSGIASQKGQKVKINYSVRLISGDIVYSSDKSGPKIFTIGSGGVESGLEEAILLMHQGDKAKLIIPSHLAFGLVGDDDKIPPKASLIYDVEILELD